ncbi:prephenate dehydratase [Clostridium sp.]|uniref:prephenate dehydratase n=1 Tax=Clostridium sp. TaxID=1506 RepID=UPI003D6CCCC3
MKDIKELRNEIDDIDSKLVELFEKRMETAIKIAQYKSANNVDVLNSNREQEVISKGESNLCNKNLKGSLKKFLNCIMEISKEVQSELLCSQGKAENPNTELVVGFQGVAGSFSEQALLDYFGENTKTKAVNEFEDIFTELENESIKYGILPIENSSTGGITDVYDLLNKYEFKIVGEVCLKVNHNLMAIEGATIDDITEVYSHSQALSQCSEFLKLKNSWIQVPFCNTAKSAEFVYNSKDKFKAAIGSRRAAALYNLNILAHNINSNSKNITRFIIISKNLEVNSECNKTSVIFVTPHRSGSLYNILRHFSENNLNLLKIESRPIWDKPWEYFFYIDFEGNLDENTVKEAMIEIKKTSSYFKILGNYKRFI